MVAFLVKRLVTGAAVVLALMFVTFLIFRTIPVDPACLIVDCTNQHGPRATPAERRAADHKLGLDKPIYIQYGNFLWRVVAHGTFGSSWRSGAIDPQIRKATGITVSIVVGGVVVLLLLAVPLGVASALRPQSLFDRGLLFVSILGIALNPFLVGLLLRKGLAQDLHLFPDGGYYPLIGGISRPCYPPGAEYCRDIPSAGGGFTDWSYHLVLPWLTFALFFLPLYTRTIRARVRETLGDPHVVVARAKGASELRVLRKHVLRIALQPLTTMAALELGGALMATIYIGYVFNTGGLGSLALETLSGDNVGYDLPLLTAIFFVVAVAVVLLNLLADLAHAWLDPRFRLEAR